MASRIRVLDKDAYKVACEADLLEFSLCEDEVMYWPDVQLSADNPDTGLRDLLKDARLVEGIHFRFWLAAKLDDAGGARLSVTFPSVADSERFDDLLQKKYARPQPPIVL